MSRECEDKQLIEGLRPACPLEHVLVELERLHVPQGFHDCYCLTYGMSVFICFCCPSVTRCLSALGIGIGCQLVIIQWSASVVPHPEFDQMLRSTYELQILSRANNHKNLMSKHVTGTDVDYSHEPKTRPRTPKECVNKDGVLSSMTV